MEIHVNICTSQSNKSIFKKKIHPVVSGMAAVGGY